MRSFQFVQPMTDDEVVEQIFSGLEDVHELAAALAKYGKEHKPRALDLFVNKMEGRMYLQNFHNNNLFEIFGKAVRHLVFEKTYFDKPIDWRRLDISKLKSLTIDPYMARLDEIESVLGTDERFDQLEHLELFRMDTVYVPRMHRFEYKLLVTKQIAFNFTSMCPKLTSLKWDQLVFEGDMEQYLPKGLTQLDIRIELEQDGEGCLTLKKFLEQNPKLVHLTLRDTSLLLEMNTAIMVVISSNQNDTLESLIMPNTDYVEPDAYELTTMLASFKKLKVLELHYKISLVTKTNAIVLRQLKKLETLRISGNKATSTDVRDFVAEFTMNAPKNLKEFVLYDANLLEPTFKALMAKMPKGCKCSQAKGTTIFP